MSRAKQKAGERLAHFARGSNVKTYLDSLGPTGEERDRVVRVPWHEIAPAHWQPRVYSSPEETAALRDSIRRNGLLHPITVRPYVAGGSNDEPSSTKYEVVAGHRRLSAYGQLWEETRDREYQSVPVIIKELDDVQARLLTHSENGDRADLGAWEVARSYLMVRDALVRAGSPSDLVSLAQRMGSESKGTASEYVAIGESVTVDLLRAAFQDTIDWAVVKSFKKADLLRIARSPEPQRLAGLKELLAGAQMETPAPRPTRRRHASPEAGETGTPRPPRFTYEGLRDRGGFKVNLSKPFSTYSQEQASAYFQDVVPAVVALAEVAAGGRAFLKAKAGRGHVLYVDESLMSAEVMAAMFRLTKALSSGQVSTGRGLAGDTSEEE